MRTRRPLVERSQRHNYTERGEIREILRESEEVVRRFLDELDTAQSLPNRRRPPQREAPNERAATGRETPA